MISWPLDDGREVTFTSEKTFQSVASEGKGGVVRSHYGKLVKAGEAPTLPGDGDSESLHLAAPIRVILPGRGFAGRLSPLLQSVLRMNDRLVLNSQFAIPTEQGGVTVHDGTYDSVKDGELSEGVLNRLAWGDGWAEYDPGLAIPPS